MDAEFLDAVSPQELRVKALVEQVLSSRAKAIEEDIAAQRLRLATAEEKLAKKMTKTWSENRRIATDKIASGQRKLEELWRTAQKPRDSRIFPGNWAPVMVVEDGQRVVKPMRFQCRPEGKPAFYDEKYPGTYNARRDNLLGFWKGQFGVRHGVIAAESFFENVRGPDGSNVVLQFTPSTHETMLIACLWSHWTAEGAPDLLSFALITDDPPPEVSAAGHDRCPVYIKPENVDRWLRPEGASVDEMFAILDDPVRPYYEHLEAA
jgi:putative SOS response-associated peptidase YedK